MKDNFNVDVVEVLELWTQLNNAKFGKTKKDKYREIASRTKKSENTIISWIRRYYEDYINFLEEIKQEKYAKICNFEGLTEMRTKYVMYRSFGFSKEEAKKEAGFSEKTKAADLEKDPKIKGIMEQLQEQLREDTKIGAQAIINRLSDISYKAENGVEYTETEYHDETNPDGRKIYKKATKRKIYSFPAAVSALQNITKMLGYDLMAELKNKPTALQEVELRIAELKEQQLKKELEGNSGSTKLLE
jgi:hypothetical protein